MEKRRVVTEVVDAVETVEGAGFVVHRPFPTQRLDHLDPFLLLDEMGPMDVAPGEAEGAPDHPHRGFETVTYLLAGEVVHTDSQGNSGRLEAGDVQWMTAGDGVVHSEMPTERLRKEGGRMHGFQLWGNLPARGKAMGPGFQDVKGGGVSRPGGPRGQGGRARHRGRAVGQARRLRPAPAIFLPALSAAAGA